MKKPYLGIPFYSTINPTRGDQELTNPVFVRSGRATYIDPGDLLMKGIEGFLNTEFSTWTADDPVSWLVQNEDGNNFITEHADGARIVSDDTAAVVMIQVPQISWAVGDYARIEFVKSSHSSGFIRIATALAASTLAYSIAGSDSDGTFHAIIPITSAGTLRVSVFRSIGGNTDYVMERVSITQVSGQFGARFDYNPLFTNNSALLIEPAGHNTWLEVLTDWTNTDCTIAKDAIGWDGNANIAYTMTATDVNATLVSAAKSSTHADHDFSCGIKRKTGTGSVYMTIDNGATWVEKTITSSFTYFDVTKTATDPQLGFKLATSGDAIYVDSRSVQLETAKFRSSTIDNSGASEGAELITDQANRDFTGTPDWTNNNINAYDEAGDLTITASAEDQYCTLAVAEAPTVEGKGYLLHFDVANLVSDWTIKSFDGTETYASGVVDTITNYVYFIAGASGGGFRITSTTANSDADFDNFSQKEHGNVRQSEAGYPYVDLPENLFAEALSNDYTSDFTVDEDSFISAGGAVAGNIDIGGQNDNLRFTTNAVSEYHNARRVAVFTVNKHYKVMFDYYIPSGQSNIDGVRAKDSVAQICDIETTTDAWTSITRYFTASATTLFFVAYDGTAQIFEDAGGDDVFYIKNIVIDEVTNSKGGGPPHGTLMVDVVWGFADTGVSAEGGIVSTQNAKLSSLYIDADGDVFTFDGVSVSALSDSFSAHTRKRCLLQWGYLVSNVAKMRTGIDLFDNNGPQWDATVPDYDGAYTVGLYLRMFYGLQGPGWMSNLRIWDRIVPDYELKGYD